MRINPTADQNHVAAAFLWFNSIVGGKLDKRVESFRQHQRFNPLLSRYFEENFALEFAIAKARTYRRQTGRYPIIKGNESAYTFLLSAYRIFHGLTPQAQTRFAGCLTGAMRDDYGLRPMAFEMEIAVHLMKKNWDVTFCDLEGLANFDLLARRDNIELEVECKTTSNDSGRKVHQQEARRLADMIHGALKSLVDESGCHLLEIIVPHRLEPNQDLLAKIAGITIAAVERKDSVSDQSCRARYWKSPLTRWPDPRVDAHEASVFFEKLFAVKNRTMFFDGAPDFSVVAVMIRSERQDDVTETLARDAKTAARQLSGKRASAVALRLADSPSAEDLQQAISNPSGIQDIMRLVMSNPDRSHVNAVLFATPQSLQLSGSNAMLSGHLAALFNPNPKYPDLDFKGVF